MTTKVKGTEGIEFPDATVQGSAAYTKTEADAAFSKISSRETKTATGTAVNFTIPAGTKRMQLLFDSISTNGTNHPSVRIGTGSVDNTGYVNMQASWTTTDANPATSATNGFNVQSQSAGNAVSGTMNLSLVNDSANRWFGESVLNGTGAAPFMSFSTGQKATAAPIDTLQITTVNQVDTFDGGTFTLICEG